jgi:hypothetical protein
MNTSLLNKSRTLRLHGLRAIDEAAVRIFLKLAQQQTRQVWALSEAQEVDLLLLAPDVPGASELAQAAPAVAWVVSREQQPPVDGRPVLNRPLQLEAFYDLLRQLDPCTAAKTAAAAQVQQASPPVPAKPAEPEVHAKYRLKRWPAAQYLVENKHYARLASFLSARFLNLSELVQLSHIEPSVCAAFVTQMHERGLLELWQDSPNPSTTEAQPAASITTLLPNRALAPSPRVGVRPVERPVRTTGTVSSNLPGLIGRLRERLGMHQRSGVGVSLAR